MKYIIHINCILLLLANACSPKPSLVEPAPSSCTLDICFEEISPEQAPRDRGSVGSGAVGTNTPPRVGSIRQKQSNRVARSTAFERSEVEPPKAGIPSLAYTGDDSESTPSLNPVDYLLQSLRGGNVVFDSPDTLVYKQSRLIKVTLYPEHISVPTITNEQTQDTIRIANTMGAYLTGQGFEITEISPAIQLISGLRETSWLWEVTPTESGPKTLHLSIMAYFSPDNTAYNIQTYSKQINVTITKPKQIQMFINEHFQWIIGTFLIPFIGMLYGLFKRRKQE